MFPRNSVAHGQVIQHKNSVNTFSNVLYTNIAESECKTRNIKCLTHFYFYIFANGFMLSVHSHPLMIRNMKNL